jgi:hypothetical protein
MKKQLLRVPRPRGDNPTIVSRVLGSMTSPTNQLLRPSANLLRLQARQPINMYLREEVGGAGSYTLLYLALLRRKGGGAVPSWLPRLPRHVLNVCNDTGVIC